LSSTLLNIHIWRYKSVYTAIYISQGKTTASAFQVASLYARWIQRYLIQRLTCAASLFFQSPNSKHWCKRNLLLNRQQSTIIQHRNVDISLPDTTTTVITLPGERSQSSPHASTRERRLAIQRISLPCVYRGFAHISYATWIYADGARHPACLPAR
jgi:hypothetical protein